MPQAIPIIGKTNPWAIILGAGTIIGFAYYFYRQGKKTVTIATPPSDSGTPEGAGTIDRIAGSLFDDMHGFNWFGNHDEAPYNQALALSNHDFVKVYNRFNERYQPETGETLMEYLNDQVTVPLSKFSQAKDSMMARLNALGLK